ncbi:MAG: protein kinase [Myxococcales bacterium]|nr:protein kinase [Myxococcales bacterium]
MSSDDPMVGAMIGRFRVLERLGSGGMGVVYEAKDTELGRQVALKLLAADITGDPDALERFRREARAASLLSHPHICTIYDIGIHDGQPYLVMERMYGRTLSHAIAARELAVVDIVRLGEEIADALDTAHRAGIVHRDLKPANLFITDRGEAKVLDFGTAKLLPGGGAPRAASDAGDFTTGAGVVVGTVAYMSPEQARGEPVDARSDLFSLGVVLYEMATGRLPFTGASTAERFRSLLSDTPAPPSRFNPAAPPGLDRVLLELLEKDPRLRFQRAATLRASLRELRSVDAAPLVGARRRSPDPRASRRALWGVAGVLGVLIAGASIVVGSRVAGDADTTRSAERGDDERDDDERDDDERGGAAAAPSVRALAVLPLSNTSGDPEFDFLAEGVAEGVINRLAQLPGITVMAPSTALRFKGRADEPVAVGRELSVDAVLTGRLLLEGDAARLELELVDVDSGALLWGESYVVRPSAAVAVEEEIAARITARLRLGLLSVAPQAPMEPEAHTLYLRGRYQLNKRTPAGFRQARALFEQALERDPEQAVLHAAVADTWALIGAYSVLPPRDAFPRALAAARRGLELDERSPEARAVLALCTFLYERRWDEAESEFRRVTASQPGFATGHHWYAEFLMARGRVDEAIAALQRARALDPLSLVMTVDTGRAYFYGRRYAEARAECERALAVSPEFVPAVDCLAMVATEEGRFDEAIAGYQQVSRLWGAQSGLPGQTMALARAGRRAEAEELLARLDVSKRPGHSALIPVAMVHAAMGRNDEAFALLEIARDERSDKIAYLKTDPRVDSLRADPRWERFARQAGL